MRRGEGKEREEGRGGEERGGEGRGGERRGWFSHTSNFKPADEKRW